MAGPKSSMTGNSAPRLTGEKATHHRHCNDGPGGKELPPHLKTGGGSKAVGGLRKAAVNVCFLSCPFFWAWLGSSSKPRL